MPEAHYDVFRYLAAPEHADLSRAIMRQFMAAKERFIVHLRAEEVQDATGERDLALQLMQLRDWGNLRADPDMSRVTSVEDFNRARFVYQLTAAGEKADIALAEFDLSFDQAGALESWALEEIVV